MTFVAVKKFLQRLWSYDPTALLLLLLLLLVIEHREALLHLPVRCYSSRHVIDNKLCWRPPQYARAPCDLNLWPFDLESGVRVTCDVGYLCANFSLSTHLCSRLRPDVRDKQRDRHQTDVRQHHRLVPPPRGRGRRSITDASTSVAADSWSKRTPSITTVEAWYADDRDVSIEVKIRRNRSSKKTSVVRRCDWVRTELQHRKRATLRQTVPRSDPQQLGLVRVELETISEHPLTDICDASFETISCRRSFIATAVQIVA